MAAHADTFDVVIVGGGTAGLVLANRLSEDPDLQVLVLEAGQDLSHLPEQLTQAVMTPAANSQLHRTPVDWDLRTVPQVSCIPHPTHKEQYANAFGTQSNMGGREIRFPQGKMLGGSSGLNGLSFTSSSKTVIDDWAELGNPGWEWSSFSQSLSKTYTVAKPLSSSPKSGSNGPLKVAYADEYTHGWPKVWADTIESLGYPGLQDTLAGQAAGGLSIPDSVDPATGTRSYAGNAYLSPEVRGRPNLKVLTGVEARRIVLSKPGSSGDGGDVVATGVEFTDPTTGSSKTVTVSKEVIVSAGTFGSPKLLELSGIGDPRRLGADNVIVANHGVGENLQNHPLTTVSLEVNSSAPPTKDAFLHAAIRQDMSVLGGFMQQYMEHHTGPFASSGVTSAAQLPLPGLDTPEGKKDLEGLFSNTGIAADSNGSSSFAVAHEKFVHSILSSPSEASGYYILGPAYAAFSPDGTSELPPLDAPEDSYITIVLLLAHPLSRGSVHVVGAGDDQKLAIDPGYFSHPLDLEVMARHVRFIEQGLGATEPLSKYLKPSGKRAVGAPEAGTLDDLEVIKK